MTVDIGQTKIATRMPIGESFMVDTELMQNRRV
jgi:hypothetical protein